MKFALVFLAVLPMVLGATIKERFLLDTITGLAGGGDVLGGVNIFQVAQQLAASFALDETEQQCETQLCPPIVSKLDFNVDLITDMVCAAACKEAQILAQHAQQLG